MKSIIFLILTITSLNLFGADVQIQKDLKMYRDLTLSIRKNATFKIALPDGRDMNFNYELDQADPIYTEPLWHNLILGVENSDVFSRTFFDRIFLKEGSKISLGDDFVPLTCIYIRGQDNRYSGIDSPLFPKIILKVYLVANDFSCTGPINPGWPSTGGKEETWDTYISFTVKDPTIMLPIDTILRYRWNEFNAVLIK